MPRITGIQGALTLACTLWGIPLAAQPSPVDRLADEFFEAWIDANPEFATFQGLEGARHDALSDNTLEGMARWDAVEDETLERVQALDTAGLAPADRVTLAYLESAVRSSVARRVCRMELWSVNHISGWQTDLPVIFASQPVGTPNARRDALARLRAVPDYLAQERRNLLRGIELGYAAPGPVVERVRDQVSRLAEHDPGESPFLEPLRRDEDPTFAAEATALWEAEVRPAFEEYAGFLDREVLPRARTEAGIHGFPDAEACYRASVHRWTTLDIPPDELFQRGQDVLAELTAARDALVAELGFESAQAALAAAGARPERQFASREEMLQYARDLVRRAEAEAPEWFGRLPEQAVRVESFPAFQEASAPGGQYLPGAPDGSRPGTYLLNTSGAVGATGTGLETLTWHEAVPGHHFQLALAQERDEAHPLTRHLFNSGFSEGWALYAELLADEMGLFSTPEARIAMYNSLRFRAVRMVVDPGMHVFGWTRDEALAFMEENLGWSGPGVEIEVDRYTAWPGQATSYLTGMLEIRRLRALAEERLGEDFDIRAFHDIVLVNGSAPLPFLESSVLRWIEAGGD